MLVLSTVHYPTDRQKHAITIALNGQRDVLKQ